MDFKILEAKVNGVRLHVDLGGWHCARIFRAEQPDGPFEEVGMSFSSDFFDSAGIEPGQTYYYRVVLSGHGLHVVRDLKPQRNSWQLPWPDGEPVRVEVPSAPQEQSFLITRNGEEGEIELGGYLDESNTVTKLPEVYTPDPGPSNPPHQQVFEPNLYVALENCGDADLINPWLVANGKRDWWSIETIGEEILAGRNLSDTEKAMAIWQFIVEEVYDSRAGYAWYDDMADPVKLLNVYGFEGCVAHAGVCRRLAEALGLEAREIWLNGMVDGHGRGRMCDHAIFEAFTEGAWHFLDSDLRVFFLRRDNATVASGEDLSNDLDLVRRSHRNLGLSGKDLAEKDFYEGHLGHKQFIYPPNEGGIWTDNAGFFTHEPGEFPPAHTMALKLRPGEKLIRYWDHVGKNVVRGRRLHAQVRFSNGKLRYRPELRAPRSLEGMEGKSNIVQEQNGDLPALHPSETGVVAEIVWRVASPYAITGARVGVHCRRQTQNDGLELLFSRDGENWRSIWIATGFHFNLSLELDWFLNPALYDWRDERDFAWRPKPCYEYYVKVAMWAGSEADGVGLDALWFDTDIQCSTRSLPSLFCGSNRIVYRDETPGPRTVKITYGWQENHDLLPPAAPEPLFPANGTEVASLDFEFRWQAPPNDRSEVVDYHVQVSRYEDFRWCVCPTFDRYLSRTRYAGQTYWQPQFPTLLNPDETYYWRVRAKSHPGVWSDWSPACAFTPHGPRPPVGLAVEAQNGEQTLIWSPHPQGNRPVQYLVYSDPARGFSVTEGNPGGTVEETCFPIPRAGGVTPRFFRVVAIDENGVASTPSEAIEV